MTHEKTCRDVVQVIPLLIVQKKGNSVDLSLIFLLCKSSINLEPISLISYSYVLLVIVLRGPKDFLCMFPRCEHYSHKFMLDTTIRLGSIALKGRFYCIYWVRCDVVGNTILEGIGISNSGLRLVCGKLQ